MPGPGGRVLAGAVGDDDRRSHLRDSDSNQTGFTATEIGDRVPGLGRKWSETQMPVRTAFHAIPARTRSQVYAWMWPVNGSRMTHGRRALLGRHERRGHRERQHGAVARGGESALRLSCQATSAPATSDPGVGGSSGRTPAGFSVQLLPVRLLQTSARRKPSAANPPGLSFHRHGHRKSWPTTAATGGTQ